MARKIAITNQKGGVGKTTTSVCLAAALRASGQRTLLVDLDSQGNASAAVGLIIENDERTLKDLILEKGQAADYIVATGWTDIIPSNNSLKDVEERLVRKQAWEMLKTVLEPVEAAYDFILFDCPPSFNVFTKNALVAAGEVMIPVDSGFFPLLGLKQLLEEIGYVKRSLNPKLELLGVLACKYDRRSSLSDQTYETLKSHFPDKLFRTVIRVNVDIVKAQIAQQNLFEYNPSSKGAEDFLALAQEIIHG
jgi:chromosome partitioning protein